MLEEGVKLPEWAKEGVTFYDPAPNSLEWHMKGIQKSYNSLTQKFVELESKPNISTYQKQLTLKTQESLSITVQLVW